MPAPQRGLPPPTEPSLLFPFHVATSMREVFTETVIVGGRRARRTHTHTRAHTHAHTHPISCLASSFSHFKTTLWLDESIFFLPFFKKNLYY